MAGNGKSDQAGIFPMLDWSRISMGARGFDASGNDFIAEPPVGIRLEAESARKSRTVLSQDLPWEKPVMTFARVLREENGVFRMWYRVDSGMCYAESEDGFHWRRPDLGLVEFNGDKSNNLCLHDGHWIEAPGVMIDPSAPAEERYKLVYFSGKWQDTLGNEIPEKQGTARAEEVRLARLKGRPLEMDVFCRTGLYGAVSSDGLRWRELPEPLLDTCCDSQNLTAYDMRRKCYIGFMRSHGPRGRSVGYAETPDFRHWPELSVVLHTDNDDPPDTDIYTSCYTPYPGNAAVQLMFPALYHHITDRVDVRMATCSSPGEWHWVDRRIVIPDGPPGSVDAGCVYACPDLVSMPDGSMGLICCVTARRHNDAFRPGSHEDGLSYQWAFWDRDRLAGIRAEGEGRFTISLPVTGDAIRINCRTEPGGWIRAELISEMPYPPYPVRAAPGYSFEECEMLTGNLFNESIRWKAGVALPAGMKKAYLRVKLRNAKIFAFMA